MDAQESAFRIYTIVFPVFAIVAVALPVFLARRFPPLRGRAYLVIAGVVLTLEILFLLFVALTMEVRLSISSLVAVVVGLALPGSVILGLFIWLANGLVRMSPIGTIVRGIGALVLIASAFVAYLSKTAEDLGSFMLIPLTLSLIAGLSWIGLFIQGQRVRPGYVRLVGIVQLVWCAGLMFLLTAWLTFGYGILAAHS